MNKYGLKKQRKTNELKTNLISKSICGCDDKISAISKCPFSIATINGVL